MNTCDESASSNEEVPSKMRHDVPYAKAVGSRKDFTFLGHV